MNTNIFKKKKILFYLVEISHAYDSFQGENINVWKLWRINVFNDWQYLDEYFMYPLHKYLVSPLIFCKSWQNGPNGHQFLPGCHSGVAGVRFAHP